MANKNGMTRFMIRPEASEPEEGGGAGRINQSIICYGAPIRRSGASNNKTIKLANEKYSE